MKKLVSLLAGLCMVGAALAAAAGEVKAVDPWVREAPPGGTVTAAYMTLENTSAEAAVLTGVESPDFDAVEMHRTMEVEGMARMVHQERIEIPAGGEVKLAPGGYHLMLFGAKRALAAGDHVPLTLKFAGGSTLELSAEVRKSTGGMHMH